MNKKSIIMIFIMSIILPIQIIINLAFFDMLIQTSEESIIYKLQNKLKHGKYEVYVLVYNNKNKKILYNSLKEDISKINIQDYIEVEQEGLTGIIQKSYIQKLLYKRVFLYLVNILLSVFLYIVVAYNVISFDIKTYKKQEKLQQDILDISAGIIAYKSEFTYEHSRLTARIAQELAYRITSNKLYSKQVYIGTLLHDIGKLTISDKVLDKPSKLTSEEFEYIKQHTIKGVEIITDIFKHQYYLTNDLYKIIKNCILYHHEKYNGEGYPLGIKADNIPLEARIVAVADVFESLYSKRPYKESLTVQEAMNKLNSLKDTHLDVRIVEELESLYHSGKLNDILREEYDG